VRLPQEGVIQEKSFWKGSSPAGANKKPSALPLGKPDKRLTKIQSPLAGDSTRADGSLTRE